MNIAQLLAEIANVNKRLAAIAVEARKEGVSAEVLGNLATEQETLIAKRAEYQAELVEKRAAADGNFENVIGGADKADERAAKIAGLSMRDKLSLALGRQVRGGKFSDAEKRALGVALTTTSETYVAATSEIDGVNNAGIFIPHKLVFDLLKEEGKLSPILADIAFTAVPGLTEFPYRKSRDKARAKAEGAEGKDNQMEWDKLSGVKGYLQTIIVVTDEVKALTDMDFGAYIIEQILQDLNEDWVEDLLYGIGSSEHIKGITIGATAAVAGGYEADGLEDALIAGIKACKGKYRRGAKVYVAQDVYDEVLFSRDDNGNFKYPVFNNATGITSFGSIRMEVDENLKDGDFVIGNVGKYFKANALIPMRLETDRKARRGTTEYIASELCCTAPVPGAFVYGFKKAN